MIINVLFVDVMLVIINIHKFFIFSFFIIMNKKKQEQLKKDCPATKIYNPISKRCILKTGKKGRELLFKDSSNNCEQIKVRWENNSCYLDSLLVAFFNRKDKIIENLLLKIPLNNYNNDELKSMGEKIQKELIKIYKLISNQAEKENKQTCSPLRKLLSKYYKKLIKLQPNKMIVGMNDDWTTSQLDIYDFYRLLELIFKFREDTLKIRDGPNIINTSFSNPLSIDFLLNASKKQSKVLKIKSVYPKFKLKYKLSKENKFRNEKGKLMSYYYKEVELLKGEKLFINVYRNIGDVKNNVRIEPCEKLKLAENDFYLHLTALIIHYGNSPNSGHYICLYKCYKDDFWYEYDDMNGITKLGEFATIKKNKNYLSNIVGLIYSKIDI